MDHLSASAKFKPGAFGRLCESMLAAVCWFTPTVLFIYSGTFADDKNELTGAVLIGTILGVFSWGAIRHAMPMWLYWVKNGELPY